MNAAGWIRSLLCCFFIAGFNVCFADDTTLDEAEIEKRQIELDERIAKLVEELGADEFATRERAQEELERLGLQAFDALYAAQSHKDVEIKYRARYLVRSVRVNWSRDDDAAEVKRILHAYGAQSRGERFTRMHRLSSLENGEGVSALCRLARFEADDQLSKRAALMVLNAEPPTDSEERVAFSRSILSVVIRSKTPGARWLQVYAATLKDGLATAPRWEEICKAEDLYVGKSEDDLVNRDIYRDLLRWRAEWLISLNEREAAFAVMRKTIEQVDDNREHLLDTTDWLMEHAAWPLVEEIAEEFKFQVSSDPQLLYRVAEAQSQQGKDEAAEETARLAIKQIPDNAEEHLIAAFKLQERGLFQWARREYEEVLKLEEVGTLVDLRARRLMAEMLHDMEDEKNAAEVLEVAVEAMDNDPKVLEIVQTRLGLEPVSVRSRLHYFHALKHRATGDHEEEHKHLLLGIREDPTDADVLIGMHRAGGEPGDSFLAETKKRIETATGHFRSEIAELRKEAEEAASETEREWANRRLATAHNQLAWLVGNTVGDYDEAVRSSHRSLELRPDAPGFLDTLGRCYYAKGDFENAVKYQSKAIALEPHSGQMNRQFDLFQKALFEQRASDKEN